MKKNKTIYFICDTIYPYHVGGAELFNHYFSSELNNDYNTITISSFSKPESITKENYIKLPKVKPLGIFFPIFIFFKLTFLSTKNNLIVLTFTRSRWIDWWPYLLLKKIRGLKYILIIHNGEPVPWKWGLPFKKLFKNAAAVIGVSQRICDDYIKRTGLIIHFIPPIMPFTTYQGTKTTTRAQWGIHEKIKIFLIVGSLKPLKNPQTVVEAALEVIEKAHNKLSVLFLFAGDGPMKGSLQKKIEEKNATKFFKFLGNVTHQNINTLYAAADYYIISSDYEGTPLALLEAMKNKLLIIAADSPGINNLIRNKVNGLLFPTQKSDILASIICNVEELDNSNIRQKAYNDFEQNYSFIKMMLEYKKLFQNILE